MQFSIRFFGQQKNILFQIQDYLKVLGFSSNISKSFKKGEKRYYNGREIIYNKDYYTLEISRRNEVVCLAKSLRLNHLEKVLRKNQIIELDKRKAKKWKDVKEDVEALRQRIKFLQLSRNLD